MIVFICKEKMKAAELAAKLAADLGLIADGIELWLGTHYLDTIHVMPKIFTSDMFFIVSKKQTFNEIARKAMKLPYLTLHEEADRRKT